MEGRGQFQRLPETLCMYDISTEHYRFFVVAVNNPSDFHVTLVDEDAPVNFRHSEPLFALADLLGDFLQCVLIQTLVSDDMVLNARQPPTGDCFFESNVDNFSAKDVSNV